VRRVAVQSDQIVTVRTAIGIATIIQVPDSPNSVVVGDQNAFKVEYLARAITIKPLRSGAKSNLYVYTDWKRYNVQLVAGPEGAADYIVYLEEPRRSSSAGGSGISWKKYSNYLKSHSLRLTVKRLGRARGGVLLVEFTVQGDNREAFQAEWLWITQNGVVRPIQSLVLSSLDVRPTEPISGVIQILISEVSLEVPIRVELRREKFSYLTLPKVAAWK
jgi:hypothetical protein